jgi:transcription elongation factor GreA
LSSFFRAPHKTYHTSARFGSVDIEIEEQRCSEPIVHPANRRARGCIGHAALEDQLHHRIGIERPRLIQRIQEAIADDRDLAENSEYQAGKADQEFNEARVAELEDKLARAEVIDVSKLSGDIIRFGATVTLIDDDSGEKKVWQIVGEPEADAKKGKISVTSPTARALIGKNKGDTVEVEAPGGAKTYKVGKVEWLRTA